METRVEQPLLKILVCDDDPADRKLVKVHLRQVTGSEVVVLEAGQKTEIQSALDKGRIDLILMDIQMPGKSGIEWLAEIVENQIAPVVMLTGAGNEDVAVRSLQSGAVGYLPKGSLSGDKLVKTINVSLERWRQMQQEKANHEDLERLVNIDSLTGLYNRRATMHRLDEEIKNAGRYSDSLSLSLLDIDYFKKVNDQYGHLVGDDVLEKIATLLRRSVRETDVVGRHGGEEFLIILSKTDLSSAEIVTERVRKLIEAAEMADSEGNVFNITVSQGLVSYEPGEDLESLVSRADDALYRAKENGRNRVEKIGTIAAV